MTVLAGGDWMDLLDIILTSGKASQLRHRAQSNQKLEQKHQLVIQSWVSDKQLMKGKHCGGEAEDCLS